MPQFFPSQFAGGVAEAGLDRIIDFPNVPWINNGLDIAVGAESDVSAG
jgi:hypothetical protein